MYKVTKAFIYRARLYSEGQEILPQIYSRLLRDKVAIRRGILDCIAPQEVPVKEVKSTKKDTKTKRNAKTKAPKREKSKSREKSKRR